MLDTSGAGMLRHASSGNPSRWATSRAWATPNVRQLVP